MALYDRLREALRAPDPGVRLGAARRAAESGDPRLVDALLEVALRDTAEVRVTGGLGESYEHVGDAAAVALGEILARGSRIDPRVAAAAEDLSADDDRAATLLYYLGDRYEPLRQSLERHPEPRVRLRAARAVLSIHRTADYANRLLVDPDPLVRLEGLQVPAHVRDDTTYLRLMHIDPAPQVRAEAATMLRFTAAGVEPFATAARREPDAGVRAALLACLAHRRRDPNAIRAIAGLLGDPDPGVRGAAAEALRDATDAQTGPVAGAAIGLRMLAEPDEAVLAALLQYRPLLRYAAELRPLIERLHRYANFDRDRHALGALLAGPARAAEAEGYPPHNRLLREILRQAAGALDPGADEDEAAALDAVHAWLADPRHPLPSAKNELGECVRAVRDGDLDRAMAAGEMAAYTAALRDPVHASPDPVRGPTTAGRRALHLARAGHALTARLLAAGAEVPPAAPLLRLLLPGEDPVEALRSVLTVEECRRGRNVAWLRLLMRPADEEWYLETVRTAGPQAAAADGEVSDWQLGVAVAAAEGRRTTGWR
ncbi:HEAT repeat domain-containing protein [Dactylosporangium sp. CA-092794]|uniref:HEAT repeat domain-containing protein n=1 Tax=Dactylosporangium sp. CA-092794 TaxID=3239929 RepID=UPI003D8A3A9A